MWQCDDVCYMSEDLAKMQCYMFSVLRVCENISEDDCAVRCVHLQLVL